MFWRMAGLSTASPVDTILDRENFTLDELLDEDEIIQECKALNSRLINFLSGRPQVEQLIRYIIEEAPEDAEKKRTFKFPFLACEIFTCEVDTILKTLIEDEELTNLLFSFLDPTHHHSNLLAGYFSKVVVCLLLRKTIPFMQYVQAHQEIVRKLVDLIGITSIMEVLIRLIGADEHMYVNHVDAMQWIEETDVLEMIVDKFSSSDSPEVHANAAEILCAITRFAPAGLSAKISSPSFIGRLFRNALEDSRPKSVLVNSLCVCISLLDPKRHTFGAYHTYNHQMTNGSTVAANPETVEGMLESLGDLLKLLDVSSAENLLTTFGKLQPPLGKNRLKIIEFISVLVTVGSEAAEKKLIDLGAVQRIIDLFFEYPYNNFLHHHVENIIMSCLESKNSFLVVHLLSDCDFVGKIIQAEKHFTLEADANKPTIPSEGKSPPRIGSIGHLTRISNKLGQLGNSNSVIQEHLQGNTEWTDWYADVLSKRNTVENVNQWACGRPTALHDRNRDSDDDDYQDRDYDVAALANNLSQAFRYGIYNNEDIEEVHGSLERDDEDVYFDDESAEVVISSLRLGDDHESGSLFTNSNWFAFEEDRDQVANERSTGALASPSPNAEEEGAIASGDDNVVTGEDEDLVDTATSLPEAEAEPKLEAGTDKLVEWVEWRESSDASDPSDALPNGESGKNDPNAAKPSALPSVALTKDEQIAAEPSVSLNESLTTETPEPTHTGSQNPSSTLSTSLDSAVDEVGDSDKGTKEIKKEVENE
ncbi:PREDICTED: serine/threonine-protein phosphatase 6 regulatory subunit 2-like isoform X1 [Lupinus angustifolius]|uniref:serine/threonine-protein phosphatase 6 regulatory subunit 2-like isoform X1 n=2 Tax=Lupinus angustifolius TaxID=3871 RepID=UPI00092F91FC|nr:PREDICTED: serine/threonine-protein phosphatase 6 regulatory subunit 2-like isoform X1 [Lupinus angustifolius]